jgi:long-chain acyl-CoA synthetase
MSLLWPILGRALISPRRTAVIDDRRSYSYAQIAGGALYMAEAIERLTDARHVGIMLPTSGAFPMALLGAWMARRVAVPLNYLLAPDELAYVIRDSDIDTIITAQPMLDFLGDAPAIPSDIQLAKMEDQDFSGLPVMRWPPHYDNDELAVILYTSGTSGRPKGVMLSHGNLTSNVWAAIRHARLRDVRTFLGVLPQFHSFGLMALTLIPLVAGKRVVYTARFVPRKIVNLIAEHRPQVFMAVPSMYGTLLSVKDASPEDFSSLRMPVCGGEPLPDAIYEACKERFGLHILEGYGLTETSPATHWATPQRNKRHSVGTALPGVRTFVVDEHDQPVEAGKEGEIILAGPNVMQGYYKLPEQTAQAVVAFRPPGEEKALRALRTGDIGKVDEQGYLYITGRKKEMLIIGGENVFPREIEEVLNRHPAIRESAVIARQDGVRGEVPIAFVELHENASFNEAEVRQFCRGALAQFKVPREIHVMDELPRNPTGKVLRRKLSVE